MGVPSRTSRIARNFRSRTSCNKMHLYNANIKADCFANSAIVEHYVSRTAGMPEALFTLNYFSKIVHMFTGKPLISVS